MERAATMVQGPSATLAQWAALAERELQAGRPAQAATLWDAALQLAPHHTGILTNKAVALVQAGRIEEAIAALTLLTARAPGHVSALNELGRLHRRLGHWREAEGVLRRALDLDPEHVPSLNNLACVLQDTERLDEAAQAFGRTLALRPSNPDLMFNYGHTLCRTGQVERGAAMLQGALRARPEDPRYLWAWLRAVPVIFEHTEEVEAARRTFAVRLTEVEGRFERAAPREAPAWLDAILPAFPVHYTGGPDVGTQRRYGGLLHRIAQAAHPELSAIPPSPRRAGERLRVGFVSTFFRRHTVSKLFRGWMTGLDTHRFEVAGFSLGGLADADTVAIARGVDHFVELGAAPRAAPAHIQDWRPDVLIYPEVGMSPDVLRLAALRLAPVQMAAWGHPVTTGLPTIDAFLSSDAMEPVDGEANYTERLVRLPRLSICYDRPDIDVSADPRSRFGLPTNRLIVLAGQSLFKYLPLDDALFVEIALRSPHALIVFISHPAAEVRRRFEGRLERAFSHRGADWRAHCLVLPRLLEADYMALNAAADLGLDSVGWSGGNTSLEAFAHGLPVLTLPGPLMRGRHTAAMLELMDLPELIASGPQDFVDLTVALLDDAECRAELRARIGLRSERLYGDVGVVRALEDELERSVLSC